MAVIVKEIAKTKSELRKYVKFGIELYKGNSCYVPPLIMDEIDTLRPQGNPAFEICDAASFMAYRDGKAVGRITGIINRSVNERSGKKTMRFGFVDFIDDAEVVDALFDAAIDWGRRRGMTSIVGPLGFSDMDPEGMLMEGYDEVGTMATIYNYPYYPKHMERMGFKKEVDWVEYQIQVPDAIPDKMKRIAQIVEHKYGVHAAHPGSLSQLAKKYGRALFELINEAYDSLYGYSPLTQGQIDHYIKMYLPLLNLSNVVVVVDGDDRLVGVGISMPSMSRALQKSGGKLMPMGWIHLLKALKGKNDVVDLLLVAIKPEYQNKGVNALLFTELIPNYQASGYRYAESNPELDDNAAVQNQWQYFERKLVRRRRAFERDI